MSDKNNVSSSHRSTYLEKLAWGAGGVTESLVNTLYSLSFPIFSIGLGVSPALMGLGQAIPRIIDAFTDPLMGNLSDNARTRWGRRRPFIFIGALLIGLTFPLIFTIDRSWPEWAHFAWFAGVSSLFFIAFTIWSVPWSALGLEMSDDYNDRTRVQLVRMIFASVATIGATWSYRLSLFFDADVLVGVRIATRLIGGVMCIMGIWSAFFVHDWRPISTQAKIRIGLAMKLCLSNKPFLFLCAATILFAGGMIAVGPLLMYVNIYYVFDGSRAAAATMMGLSGTLSGLIAALTLPVGGRVAALIGKRHAAFIALGLIIFGKCSQIVLVTPAMPYLQLVSMLIYQPGIMLMWCLIPSMIADVCDMDELTSGQRREASFSSIYQWIWKVGATLAMLMSGLLIQAVGARTETPEALLSPDVVFRLRLLLALFPAFMGLLSATCIWRYPLTRDKVLEIKEALRNRSEVTPV